MMSGRPKACYRDVKFNEGNGNALAKGKVDVKIYGNGSCTAMVGNTLILPSGNERTAVSVFAT